MIKFLVDSASDYTCDEAHACGLEYAPLKVQIDGKEYESGVDLNSDQFYEKLIATDEFPKTSQPSPSKFVEIFEKAESNHDELICVLLSTGLSGTYQSAALAKEIVGYQGIHLIDSLSATHMIRIIVDYGRRLAGEGLTAADIVEELNKIKSKIRVIVAVDTLEYLCMGGRLSRVQAKIGEMASIKPIVSLNEVGSVFVKGKALGTNKCLNYLVNLYKTSTIDERFPVYSLYTYGENNVSKLEDKLKENNLKFDGRGQIGSTIGAHVGPGAYGIIFVEK